MIKYIRMSKDDSDRIPSSLPIPVPKEDSGIVNYILSSLPLSLIHKLRDVGVINTLNDILVTFIGFGILLTKPSLLLDFLAISKRIKIYKYGKANQKILELFDTKNNINESKSNDILLFVHGGITIIIYNYHYYCHCYNYSYYHPLKELGVLENHGCID